MEPSHIECGDACPVTRLGITHSHRLHLDGIFRNLNCRFKNILLPHTTPLNSLEVCMQAAVFYSVSY